MSNSGEGKDSDIIREAEEVSQRAQLDHNIRDATKSILGIPKDQEISDEELEAGWQKHIEKIDDLRTKWNVPPGEDPVDYLLRRLQKKYGL